MSNPTSNQYVGAERFMSDDARGVLCVRAEHYEALRQRFEKACARVTELESAVETAADSTTMVLARRVIQSGNTILRDHGCGRCVPGGEMVDPTFTCAYHRALDYVGNSPPALKTTCSGDTDAS